MKHYSVLKHELISALKLENGAAIDCTLGYGGHTLGILEYYNNVFVYGFDRDISALDLAKTRLKDYASRVRFAHCPFASALNSMKDDELREVRGIIADIGVSSMQLDEPHRGFSFYAENLDMRMDTSNPLTAKEVINSYAPTRLEEIFRIYGEFRQSKKLAALIKEERAKAPITSCRALSELIERHFPRIGGLHPATLPFQALRIEVNGELEQLEGLLASIESAYLRGALQQCRVAIISFHSLEDRIIKHRFQQWAKPCRCPQNALKCECGNNHALGVIITKKPILPHYSEIAQNKRSRSAKLRIFELGAHT